MGFLTAFITSLCRLKKRRQNETIPRSKSCGGLLCCPKGRDQNAAAPQGEGFQGAQRQNGRAPFRRRARRAVSISASPFFLTQPQVKLASGGCGVRCVLHFKPVDRSASCWEIQKGGSPFGRFKGFPKGEYEIPLWRALSFRLHPVSFCTSRKKWGGFLRTATRDAVRTNTSSDRPLGGHLPLEGKALKVRSTSCVPQGFPLWGKLSPQATDEGNTAVGYTMQ